MVPNLPYFMVQFDYKGEKGYGHVIEGVGAADKEAEEDDIDEGEKGGGAFPRYRQTCIPGPVTPFLTHTTDTLLGKLLGTF